MREADPMHAGRIERLAGKPGIATGVGAGEHVAAQRLVSPHARLSVITHRGAAGHGRFFSCRSSARSMLRECT